MKKKEDSKYKKISVIHKGADNTSVYLAINTKKNILTAIKSIPKDKMSVDSQKNFRRELQNLHNLDHPNIIKILDYLNNKTSHYIILEYCNGGNLADYVNKYKENYGKPLNEFFIQKILRQITPALEYMHSKHTIHRDIKLANILLNFNNYPNIPKNGRAPQSLKFSEKSLNKDFSAKITGLNFSKDLIQDNMGSTILGTPLYMSPDVVEKLDEKNTKKYNTSADLWSLGVITYELLTGQMPFTGNEPQQVFNNIEKGIYKLPSKLKASIEIITFINGLLQYYPEKRLNWDEIKVHPFLTKNVEDFNYIDLELYSEKEKKEVEINSKDSSFDNLLWFFLKIKGLEDLKVDKINQKEIKESKMEDKINKAKVINEEVIKATKQEKIEREKEREEINKLKKEAEEDKKKAELERQKRKEEQDKLIKEENELNTKREKLIQESEKNKKGSEENQKKSDELKELEKKIAKIKEDKDIAGQKLLKTEQQIAEAKKKQKFSENKIKKMEEEKIDNNDNEQYKNEIEKLNKEKNNKHNEVEKLKKEEELKQQQYIKEKEELEKKKKEISEEKKKLENEMNKNKEVKNKINDTDKQLQSLEDELKQKQEEKEKEILKIKEVTDGLKNQIEQFNKVIEEKKKEKEEAIEKIKKEKKEKEEKEKKEKKEKEKKEKEILGSFIQINKEQIEKEKEQEKEQEKEEEKEKEQENKEEDEWETISEKDINFDDDTPEIDPYFTDYEIVENYVDMQTAKNEGK